MMGRLHFMMENDHLNYLKRTIYDFQKYHIFQKLQVRNLFFVNTLFSALLDHS
jgi:hypothetical protein